MKKLAYTELRNCLNGTSDYCHAGKVKKLYETLDSMGNNKQWQLYVLDVLREGVAEQIANEHYNL